MRTHAKGQTLNGDDGAMPYRLPPRRAQVLRICHIVACFALFFQTLYFLDVIEVFFEPSSTLNRFMLFSSLAAALVFISVKLNLAMSVLRLAWPILPIIVWFWMTSFWSAFPELTRQRSIAFAVAYVSALGLAVGMRSPRGVQLTLCWTASVVIIADLISFAFPSFSQSDIGFKGIHVHKNVAGFAAIMCGTILAFSVPQLRTPTSRFFTITLTVLAFVLLVLSKSKTNLFVLLILIGMVPLYLLLIRQQEAKLRHFVLTCVICALIFLIGASGSKLSALGALYGDPTLTNRAVIWVEVEKFIAQSPWTGIGFGSFWDTGGEWNLFPVGYYVFYNDPSIVNVSHNGYVDVLLHGGRIALFFGYVVTANVLCFTLAIATGSSVPRHHKWTFCMLHCLIIMILVQNLTESSMFFPSSSSSYFFLILLAQAARWKVSLDDNKRQIAKYARHMAIDPNSRIPSSMS